MLRKIILVTLVLLLVSAVGFTGYQYGDFERSKPIDEWCDNIKLISPAPGVNTMSFVKFSMFDKKLDPQVVYSINGSGVTTQSFQNIKFPPTYQFSTQLKKNSINYSNIMVVNIPKDVANNLKSANTVNVIFFSNGKPIPCKVPDLVLNEWKSKLK